MVINKYQLSLIVEHKRYRVGMEVFSEKFGLLKQYLYRQYRVSRLIMRKNRQILEQILEKIHHDFPQVFEKINIVVLMKIKKIH